MPVCLRIPVEVFRMNLIEQCDVDLQRLDMNTWREPHMGSTIPRSRGVHRTGVIAHLWFGSLPVDDPQRLQKEKEAAEELGDITAYPLRMALGVAWERWAAGL